MAGSPETERMYGTLVRRGRVCALMAWAGWGSLRAGAVTAPRGTEGRTLTHPPREPVSGGGLSTTEGPGGRPLTVTFDVSGSRDPEWQIASYRGLRGWGTGPGPPPLTTSSRGFYTPRLHGTDNRGAEPRRWDSPCGCHGSSGGTGTDIAGFGVDTMWMRRVRGPGGGRCSGAWVPFDATERVQERPGSPINPSTTGGSYRFEGVDTGRSWVVTQALRAGGTRCGGAVPPGVASGNSPDPSPIIGGSTPRGGVPFMVALLVPGDHPRENALHLRGLS